MYITPYTRPCLVFPGLFAWLLPSKQQQTTVNKYQSVVFYFSQSPKLFPVFLRTGSFLARQRSKPRDLAASKPTWIHQDLLPPSNKLHHHSKANTYIKAKTNAEANPRTNQTYISAIKLQASKQLNMSINQLFETMCLRFTINNSRTNFF